MKIALQQLTESLNNYDEQKGSLRAVFESVAAVFSRMKEQGKEVRECEEALQKVKALLQPYLDPIAIQEDLLMQILSDPSYFNREDWESAQKAKEEIQDAMQILIPLFFERSTVELSPKETPIEKKKRPPRPPKRSDWLKS